MLQRVQQSQRMYHGEALSVARARQVNKEDYVKKLKLNN